MLNTTKFTKNTILWPIIPSLLAAIIYGAFFIDKIDSSHNNVLSNNIQTQSQTIIVNVIDNQEKTVKSKIEYDGTAIEDSVYPKVSNLKMLNNTNGRDLPKGHAAELNIKEAKLNKSIVSKVSEESFIKKKVNKQKLGGKYGDSLHSNFIYPCTGKIDQIEGVLMNHVHIAPSADSPSKPPAEGGAQIIIENYVYQDNKDWFKISYEANNNEYSGWMPTNYVLPFSDCYNN